MIDELLSAIKRQDYDVFPAVIEMIDLVNDGYDPEQVLICFGLEPDYVIDLLFAMQLSREQIANLCLKYHIEEG
jgi:hypothetical protein